MRIALAFVLVVAALPLAAPTLLADNPWYPRPFLSFAHQGGETEAPSNTMYAFKRAIREVGADVIELDVHATADGQLVVIHDTTVDRTTDGSGRVDRMTLAQVQALDAAYWFSPGCNPPCATGPYPFRGVATGAVAPPAGYAASDFAIPTLREVLVEFPATPINIEIKRTAPDTLPYEKALADLLAEFGRDADDALVVSFSDHATEAFRLHNSDVSTAFGLGETAAWYGTAAGPLPGAPSHHAALQVPTVYQGLPVVTADFVADAHARGLAVHVWTIDDAAEMESLLCLGVDGIMTSKPSVLEAVLAGRGVEWTCP